jgi:hypothetical protein
MEDFAADVFVGCDGVVVVVKAVSFVAAASSAATGGTAINPVGE